MENYKTKYIKYKTKYINYKRKYHELVGGVRFENYFPVFNSRFQDNWVLTGSLAVYLYCLFLNIEVEFSVNDLDIIYVSDKRMLYDKSIGEFYTSQDPNRSMTFTNEVGESFDVIVAESSPYRLINGVKLLDPNRLLDNYKEEFDISEKKDRDLLKINTLMNIIDRIEELPERRVLSSRPGRPSRI